ncbi:MAG: hypothetical protein AB7O52_08025 [Planctomycetota bacterium]
MTRWGLLVAGVWLSVAGATHGQSTPGVAGFLRGDCNGDSQLDLADPVATLCALFAAEVPPCRDACDLDDSGRVDAADVILALANLFGSTPSPPTLLGCERDSTRDGLDCATPSCTAVDFVETRSWTLPVATAGAAYRARLPADAWVRVAWSTGARAGVVREAVPFLEFGWSPGAPIPAGLDVDPRTGEIVGVAPSPGVHALDLWARWDERSAARFHAHLTVFAPGEPEIVPAQDLTTPGANSVAVVNDSFEFVHENPWPPAYPLWQCVPNPALGPDLRLKPYRVYLPAGDGPAPLLIFHHGTGFGHLDYAEILTHLATRGVICVSVDDPYSFGDHVVHYCWGGHDEAARVLVATRQHLEGVAQDPSSALAGRIDGQRVFYGGHSRGAAAAIIAAEFDPNTRGVIALQPTDATGESWIGYTDRWERLPTVPLLIISAEQDFDVVFPGSERLLERATGPTTQVTIYGGCHGYTTNSSANGCQECNWVQAAPWLDYCRYISRTRQHDWTAQFATAFLQRHAFADLSVDGILYGAEYQTSSHVGVAHRRHHIGTRVLDDFSDHPHNQLGQLTASSGGTVQVGACYDLPNDPPAPITAISNLIVTLTGTPVATHHVSPLSTPAGPLDATPHQRLKFRIKNPDRWGQVDNFGFGWLDASVTLLDADGDSATVDLGPHLPTTPFHPTPEPPGTLVRMKYQRFVTVSLDLDQFTQRNPGLDLDRLTELDWTWTAGPGTTTTPRIAIDDILLE